MAEDEKKVEEEDAEGQYAKRLRPESDKGDDTKGQETKKDSDEGDDAEGQVRR